MDAQQSTTRYRAYKYRIYPTVAQAKALDFHFGAVRYVYNRYRAVREGYYQDTGETLSETDCCLDLTDHKREAGNEWLQQAYNQSLQQAIRDLDRAYRNFFAGRARYPRFKSKRSHQSIRYLFAGSIQLRIANGRIRIPKVGYVKITQHRRIEGTPKNMTVSKSKSGKFFVSIQCEVDMTPSPAIGPEVGIDLGLKTFVTLSDGRTIDPPKHLRKAERRLKRLQRRLSRKRKGSANRRKAKVLLARQHEKVANRRADFLHKLSRQLVDTHSHIGVENLHVKGMLRNHSLAKSIVDAGWGEFVRQLEYKGDWYGCKIIKVDRWFASSKTCSACNAHNAALDLSDRRWVCQQCGAIHDRDLNAARNILKQSTARTVGIDARGKMSRCSKTTQPGNLTASGPPVQLRFPFA